MSRKRITFPTPCALTPALLFYLSFPPFNQTLLLNQALGAEPGK